MSTYNNQFVLFSCYFSFLGSCCQGQNVPVNSGQSAKPCSHFNLFFLFFFLKQRPMITPTSYCTMYCSKRGKQCLPTGLNATEGREHACLEIAVTVKLSIKCKSKSRLICKKRNALKKNSKCLGNLCKLH